MYKKILSITILLILVASMTSVVNANTITVKVLDAQTKAPLSNFPIEVYEHHENKSIVITDLNGEITVSSENRYFHLGDNQKYLRYGGQLTFRGEHPTAIYACPIFKIKLKFPHEGTIFSIFDSYPKCLMHCCGFIRPEINTGIAYELDHNIEWDYTKNDHPDTYVYAFDLLENRGDYKKIVFDSFSRTSENTVEFKMDKSLQEVQDKIAEVRNRSIPNGIYLNPGWNLITLGEGGDSSCIMFDFKEFFSKCYYVIDPNTNEYIQYKKMEENEGLYQYLSNTIESKGYGMVWVYSPVTCECGISEKLLYKQLINLSSGWNFVPILNSFVGLCFTNIAKDCDVERAYIWDSKNQQWVNITDHVFTESEVMSGMIIRVKNSCELKGALYV